MKAAIIQALLSLGFQHMWAFQVIESAERHDLDPEVVAGVILSEHVGYLGNRAAGAVNKRSKCVGLGQIAPWWPRNEKFQEIGSWRIEQKDLVIPMHNIEATARVLRIAKEDHLRAHGRRSDHHWLAHYKCGWKSVGTCETPVRNALRYIHKVRSALGLDMVAMR